ncbi:MAG: NPCBM/NEW2 domain-containing protein [Pirellulaceae bacterium]
MRKLPVKITTFIALCLLLAGPLSAETLTLLDGRKIEGELQAITPTGRLEGPGIPEGLVLDALRGIQRAATSDQSPPPRVIVQLHGGEVRAAGVTLADEKLHIAWPHGEPLVVPIDLVRAIRFDTETAGELFDEALAKPSAEHDRLFVKIDDRLQSLTGLVEKITDAEVVFEFDGQKRTLARKQLYGIVVAQFNDADRKPPPCRLTLAGGSRLEGAVNSLADGQLELALRGETTVRVPLSSVERLEVRSSRMAFLSDLEPSEVEESALLTQPSPWRRDRSVGGRPLSLTVQESSGAKQSVATYEKGLGVHARSRISFDIGGDYRQFAAEIGIDAETEGRGDCEFVVLGDGRELYRQRVRGDDAPRKLQLDIQAVRNLTLLVEPGEDFDLADHADWCDARLLRGAAP